MTRRATLLSLLLAVGIVVGFGLAIGSNFEDRPPRQQDDVTVVSATGQTVDSASGVPPSVRRAPSIPDWTGRERSAVVRALGMPSDAGIRDVTVFAQVLCGQAQDAADQPFRRFAYVRTARLGAWDDGSAAFEQTYRQLCR